MKPSWRILTDTGTDFFKAFCDPTRLHILLTLARKNTPCTVSSIAAQCDVDFSVVSRHLSLLKRTGIVETNKSGREVFYSFNTQNVVKTLRACADALETCCPPTENKRTK